MRTGMTLLALLAVLAPARGPVAAPAPVGLTFPVVSVPHTLTCFVALTYTRADTGQSETALAVAPPLPVAVGRVLHARPAHAR